MRFIGSKISLLKEIESILPTYIKGQTFCDIFSGTACVARYFKQKYKIISNDLLYFSYVLQKAYLCNNERPTFMGLELNPLDFLNNNMGNLSSAFFYENYSPNKHNERMFFTNENALKIDFIRQTIEEWYIQNNINQDEYFYLLACLIEAVPFVSNTTGTYGAYLKIWDKRALKTLTLNPIELTTTNTTKHFVFNRDAKELIREISGDILYLDPPYNSRQYGANYHILETIAKYDNPQIKGKVGIREYRELKSKFCNSKKALSELEYIVKKANFKHIVLSYNDEGIMSMLDIENLLRQYAKFESYKMKKIPYKRYKRTSEEAKSHINELLFYIEKR